MDYMYMLGIHTLFLGERPQGNGRPELQLGRRDFFFVPADLISIFTIFCVPSSSVSLSLFSLAAQVFGRSLVHEFIFYSHTVWNLL